MKKTTCYLATIILVALPLLGFAEDHDDENSASKTPASIQLSESIEKTELPKLAQVTFDQALAAARAAVPGAVIKAELEVENGGLMYSFEIVTANREVKEVEIDAGNGRVLDIDVD